MKTFSLKFALAHRRLHWYYFSFFPQYKVSLMPNEWQTRYMQELPDMLYKIKREENEMRTEEANREAIDISNMRSTMPTNQAWCLRALRKIRKRICVIIVIAGVVVMMVSVYGIYFRAFLCSNGKSCVTSLRYTHVKHALF